MLRATALALRLITRILFVKRLYINFAAGFSTNFVDEICLKSGHLA
jgi:hypothetical protein